MHSGDEKVKTRTHRRK